MYYYINSFFLYSVIGFIIESVLYKITLTNKHSGIFYGPITAVYGFAIIILLLLNKYVFPKIKTNKYLKIIIMYIIIVLSTSFIEFLGGNILYLLFKIDMWNYSKHFIHFGKYVCLTNSLIWGILGLLYLYYIKSFFDKLIKRISPKTTYLFLLISIIDLIFVFANKLTH